MNAPLRLLILGAHPDDAEFHAGGLTVLYRRAGHQVRIVSLTNGDAGHQRQWGAPLALRRRAEAAAAGQLIGAEYVTWDHHDGQLQPTLELRWQVIGEIRRFAPDLVLTHRPDDYHPDHRAVGQVVRDASYLVTVPAVVPDVPILRRDPVVAYMPDRFTKPYPLQADVAVDTTEAVEQVVDMLLCHESQVLEWLPYNRQIEALVPTDPAGRREFVRRWYLEQTAACAARFRPALVDRYGSQRGAAIASAEAFEISEYAAPLDDALRARLFPW